MPRERNPLRDRAKELWDASDQSRGVLKGIAADLGVPESRIRKWKSEDGWDAPANRNAPKKKKGSAPNPSKRNAPKKQRQRGGQPGNKNAAGSPGPAGHQNNFKHGLYESIYWDTLKPDELEMIEAMTMDLAERHLIDIIKLLTVRERRLLTRIQRFEDMKGGLALESVTSRKLEIEGSVVLGKKQTQQETITRTISTFEVIDKMEAKLTQVQRAKAQCLALLEKLRQEGTGEGNGNIDQLMASIDAARKKWGGGS